VVVSSDSSKRYVLLTALIACLACSDKETTPGQLIVSIQSDVALPKQVDTVRLEVLVRGALQFGNDFSVGQSANLIPATLTLLAGNDPSTPVTIRVLGKKGAKTRTLRETVTTVPEDRIASLRMPIQWLCDDSARPTDEGDVETTCDRGYTCSAGRCVESEVPEPSLPDYAPEDVFGGGSTPEAGSCFDTVACMGAGQTAEPDVNCSIQRPSGGVALNVALQVEDDGICDESNIACFVPLDGESDDGWRSVGERVSLPPAACDRLAAGRVRSIVASTACETKTQSLPPCGPWSSVPKSSAPPTVAPPMPTLIGSAVGAGKNVCCSLHADASRFYTCECSDAADVEIVGLKPPSSTLESVASLSPEQQRNWISAALSDDTLFWTDREADQRSRLNATRLATNETAVVASVDADIFDTSPLLLDDDNVYALASRVEGQDSAVQLVVVDRASSAVRSFAVGNRSALQFAQDQQAVYVISHSDSLEGAQTRRVSEVSRFAKSNGARTPLASITITSSDVERVGFVGLSADDSWLLALSRKPLGGSTDEVSLVSIDSTGQQVALFTQSVDAGRTKFLILGISEERALLVRYLMSSAEADATIESGALLVVPRQGGLPRVAAEFVRDAPAASVRAPAFDSEAIYWLNASGLLYRLPLSALR
jgi:hypothetical protein